MSEQAAANGVRKWLSAIGFVMACHAMTGLMILACHMTAGVMTLACHVMTGV